MRQIILLTHNKMFGTAVLECYVEDLEKWCKFELIDTLYGSIETMVKIQDESQLPEQLYGRYLYNNDPKSNVWFYVSPIRSHVRIRRED